MGRLRELLDELQARKVAATAADDARATDGWRSEGGADAAAQRVVDVSESSSAPTTSSGRTDSV
jgi:hypothetical protein